MSLTRQLGFYVSDELYDKVIAKLKKRDQKLSEVLRQLLWNWVEKD